jgi:hypothetical protein
VKLGQDDERINLERDRVAIAQGGLQIQAGNLQVAQGQLANSIEATNLRREGLADTVRKTDAYIAKLNSPTAKASDAFGKAKKQADAYQGQADQLRDQASLSMREMAQIEKKYQSAIPGKIDLAGLEASPDYKRYQDLQKAVQIKTQKAEGLDGQARTLIENAARQSGAEGAVTGVPDAKGFQAAVQAAQPILNGKGDVSFSSCAHAAVRIINSFDPSLPYTQSAKLLRDNAVKAGWQPIKGTPQPGDLVVYKGPQYGSPQGLKEDGKGFHVEVVTGIGPNGRPLVSGNAGFEKRNHFNAPLAPPRGGAEMFIYRKPGTPPTVGAPPPAKPKPEVQPQTTTSKGGAGKGVYKASDGKTYQSPVLTPGQWKRLDKEGFFSGASKIKSEAEAQQYLAKYGMRLWGGEATPAQLQQLLGVLKQ